MRRAFLHGLLLTALGVAPAVAGPRLAVVGHPVRSPELTVGDLAQIFLKKRRFWADGEPILPVNREATSEVRQAFTESIFEGQAGRLVVYWNRQYFQGILPPATLASDEAVKRFVAGEPPGRRLHPGGGRGRHRPGAAVSRVTGPRLRRSARGTCRRPARRPRSSGR